jgi:hypothetical protein
MSALVVCAVMASSRRVEVAAAGRDGSPARLPTLLSLAAVLIAGIGTLLVVDGRGPRSRDAGYAAVGSGIGIVAAAAVIWRRNRRRDQASPDAATINGHDLR